MSTYHKFEIVENNAGDFFTKFLVGEEDVNMVFALICNNVTPAREPSEMTIADTDYMSDKRTGTKMKFVTLKLRKDEPVKTFIDLKKLGSGVVVVEPGMHSWI